MTALAKHYAGVDFKTVALDLKDHPHFKFVMNLVRGKTNNYLDYYERNRLREVWSLEQIDLGEFAGEPEEEA